MKKGIHQRLASGVILVFYLNCLLLFEMLTHISLVGDKYIIYIIGILLSFFIGKVLNRKYNKDNNYDIFFYILLLINTIILVILLFARKN